MQSRGGGRGVGGGIAGGVASGVVSRRAHKGLHRRTFCVVPTWRTGGEEFKVFTKTNVDTCSVHV